MDVSGYISSCKNYIPLSQSSFSYVTFMSLCRKKTIFFCFCVRCDTICPSKACNSDTKITARIPDQEQIVQKIKDQVYEKENCFDYRWSHYSCLRRCGSVPLLHGTVCKISDHQGGRPAAGTGDHGQ